MSSMTAPLWASATARTDVWPHHTPGPRANVSHRGAREPVAADQGLRLDRPHEPRRRTQRLLPRAGRRAALVAVEPRVRAGLHAVADPARPELLEPRRAPRLPVRRRPWGGRGWRGPPPARRARRPRAHHPLLQGGAHADRPALPARHERRGGGPRGDDRGAPRRERGARPPPRARRGGDVPRRGTA